MKYKQLVGSLIYLTTTRPKISFDFWILSKFMQNPCEGNWYATTRVLKYFKGTQDFGLRYSKVDDFDLIKYSNLEFVGDKKMECQI
jgi:hypothetical protein